jgi:hypothetical protein
MSHKGITTLAPQAEAPTRPLLFPTDQPRDLQQAVIALINAHRSLASQVTDLSSHHDALELSTSLEVVRPDAISVLWLGAWSAGDYFNGDMVTEGSRLYIANKDTSETPTTGASDWDIAATTGAP